MQQLPLEAADIKKLRLRLLPFFAFAGFSGLIFAFIGFAVLGKSKDPMAFDDIAVYVFIGFGVFFFSVIGYMIWAVFADLKRGVKNRISGMVTNKRLNVHHSQTHHHNTSRNHSSKTTRHYYLYIDDEEHSVDFKHYNKAKVGMHIVLDKAPKSKMTLAMELTGQEVVDQKAHKLEGETNDKFLQTIFPDVKLTPKDEEVLKNIFKSQQKARYVWLVPTLIMLVTFLANGLEGLLILFFPVVIIPAYQLFKIIRSYRTYKMSKRYGFKRGIPAIIEDKTTFTSNRSKSAQRLKTTIGVITVESVTFDQLQVGDRLVVFKPQYGKQPLSIMTMDQQEYYLY
ncbi:hypothetical protein BXY85_3931 [Roseivirga pacifica]|uniref:Uncharacterized protein n=1 Tax=Roseivirga pacifica TaxID=1267423 RepID=A0A1I0Q255_9BACT|nr:hypothetical protein [Roseivirga pacifica]RKQ43312.1 hypothetical protein BXY85_3931 [Roseivirga pacifica]SEW21030.1 hypothetical protein SAMN05216290_1944 [Roseivirga pacifica]